MYQLWDQWGQANQCESNQWGQTRLISIYQYSQGPPSKIKKLFLITKDAILQM